MDTRKAYPTDLTGPQWAQVCRFIPAPKPGGRPAKYDRREIANALLYVARTGCQWRAHAPRPARPGGSCTGTSCSWKKDGTFDRLHDVLRGDLRQADGRQRQPSAAIIDSQSVKTTEKGGRTATTPARRSTAASGTSWWIRSG